MQTTNTYKEVYFDQYCKTCVSKDKPESDESCHGCLAEPCREYSHKPLNYKEAAKRVNKTAGEDA